MATFVCLPKIAILSASVGDQAWDRLIVPNETKEISALFPWLLMLNGVA